MRIANPIYDVVFKYLLDDEKVARVVLSALLDKEVLERLLEVFDQGLASRSDPHLLDILEENFPERHREVLRRLMRAGAEQ
ncbi:MAG: hypothetical protein P4L36_13720, partial [Holophaga sp.]|nr:hypothetical protein [Holophaga sp.]